MTPKELYDWAVENGAENFDIGVTQVDEWGEDYWTLYPSIEHVRIDIEREEKIDIEL